MSKAVIKTMVSAEDYLAGEEAAEGRHEYMAGEIYAIFRAGLCLDDIYEDVIWR